VPGWSRDACDAVLAKEGAEEVSFFFWGGGKVIGRGDLIQFVSAVLARHRPCCHPLGIITLEDVLEGRESYTLL